MFAVCRLYLTALDSVAGLSVETVYIVHTKERPTEQERTTQDIFEVERDGTCSAMNKRKVPSGNTIIVAHASLKREQRRFEALVHHRIRFSSYRYGYLHISCAASACSTTQVRSQ